MVTTNISGDGSNGHTVLGAWVALWWLPGWSGRQLVNVGQECGKEFLQPSVFRK